MDVLGSPLEVASSTAVLLERGGRFFVFQTNLGIIGSDRTVEGAYRRFAAAKAALAEEAERAGLRISPVLAPTRAPAYLRQSGSGQRSILGELTMFLAKIAIVILIVGGIGATIVTVLGRDAKPLGMADIADKAGEIARDVSGLSPEKKESLRRSVGVLSRELGPVIDAWRNPPSQ